MDTVGTVKFIKMFIKTQLADSVQSMESHQKERVQQLSTATSSAFHHTCLGLVDLT